MSESNHNDEPTPLGIRHSSKYENVFKENQQARDARKRALLFGTFWKNNTHDAREE